MDVGWDPVARKVRVVHPVRVDKQGIAGPTSGQVRGPNWRRTSAGLFVPAEVLDDTVEQRIVEAAARVKTGAVTGWAALRLHGGGYFDGLAHDGRTRRPVALATGRDRLRPRAGVELHRAEVTDDEAVVRYGVRCVTAERALFDEMRWTSSLEERVGAMDMAAAAQLTSIARMSAYARDQRRKPGRFAVTEALWWADEHAWSPQEVRLRMIWRRVIRAKPLCNRPVLDLDGGLIGIPDLLDEESGMAGEFNGAVHRTRTRYQRDVHREDKFRRAGLEPFTVVGDDLDNEALVIDRMQAARERAGRNPRRWVVAAEARPTLDERLDLRDRALRLADGTR